MQTDLSRGVVFSVNFKAISYYLEDDISSTEIAKINKHRMDKFSIRFWGNSSAVRNVYDVLEDALLTIMDDVMYGNTD